MPIPPNRPDALRNRVFRGSWAVRTGLLTEDQLRSAAWRRLRRDVYAPAELAVDHRLLVYGVSMVAPGGAVFSGRSALVLAGGDAFATAEDPVEVTLPPGGRWRPAAGVRISARATDGDVVVGRFGLWRTGPVRTALDLVRRLSVDDGVVLLDQLVQGGLTDLAGVRDAAGSLARCRGSAVAREATRLADGLAESPPETRLRLLMLRAGLPMPVAQFRVFDDHVFVGRVDFAYPDLKIAIEYDGAWHAEPGQFSRDRRRLNRLRAAGWTVLHVTAADMHDPSGLVAQIRSVINSRPSGVSIRSTPQQSGC